MLKLCAALISLSNAIDRYDVGARIQVEDIAKWNEIIIARNELRQNCKVYIRRPWTQSMKERL